MSADHDRAERLAHWCIEQHGDSWERGFLPADAATVSEAYLELISARQPSPSARDVAHRFPILQPQVCHADTRRMTIDSAGNWTCECGASQDDPTCKPNPFADTLGNESAAAQATSDRGTSSAMSAEASDPNGTGTGPASAADISVGNESVAQENKVVAGSASVLSASDSTSRGLPNNPAATDAAPEARELTADAVDAAENELIAGMSDPTVKQAEALDLLRDGAMSAVRLQQALARAQEDLSDECPGTPLGRLKALADYAVKRCGHQPASSKPAELAIIESFERAEKELANLKAKHGE